MLHLTIGDYLVQIGSTRTTANHSPDDRVLMMLFSAADKLDSETSQESFVHRYGFRYDALKGDGNDPSQAGIDRGLFTSGSLCGHDIPRQHAAEVHQVARHPSNPFSLADNANYIVTEQDLLDLEYVCGPGSSLPAWLSVWPGLAQPILGGGVAPLPVDPIKPVTKPGLTEATDTFDPTIAADAHCALVWPALRRNILAHHGVVGVLIREEIFAAFLPLAIAAAQVGLIGPDGKIQGGVDE